MAHKLIRNFLTNLDQPMPLHEKTYKLIRTPTKPVLIPSEITLKIAHLISNHAEQGIIKHLGLTQFAKKYRK
jgi:hypothetical protein